MSNIFELWDNNSSSATSHVGANAVTRPTPVRNYSGTDHPYAVAALEGLCTDIAAMPPDSGRDTALNDAAYRMAGYVAAGHISEQRVRDELHHAGRASGQTEAEVSRVLRLDNTGALMRGKADPKDPPPLAQQPLPPLSDEHVDEPSSSELDEFWSARELLQHVQTYAQARRASPWATLGCVLARIVAATPPSVVLPSIIGGHASLNTFVALVGTSGSGKGAAERVATECLRVPHIVTVTTGSGEGIAHAYKRRRRNGELEDVTDAVLFSVPEIDTLSALGSRQGATLLPELRRGWSGEALGFAYADPSRRLPIEQHTYRMCLIAGIQPGRARALLDDADGGTPQRFIWVSATDRHAPERPPDPPAPKTWAAPAFGRHDLRDAFSGRCVMDVCELARHTIDDARYARLRGDGDALDGHLLLAQLKTAAALALADTRLNVSEADWALANVVVRQSTATRTSVAHTLTDALRVKNRRRAEGDAERSDIAAGELFERQMRRATRAVLRKLNRADVADWVTGSDARRAVQAHDRDVFENVVEALITTGQIEEQETSHGRRYRIV